MLFNFSVVSSCFLPSSTFKQQVYLFMPINVNVITYKYYLYTYTKILMPIININTYKVVLFKHRASLLQQTEIIQLQYLFYSNKSKYVEKRQQKKQILLFCLRILCQGLPQVVFAENTFSGLHIEDTSLGLFIGTDTQRGKTIDYPQDFSIKIFIFVKLKDVVLGPYRLFNVFV